MFGCSCGTVAVLFQPVPQLPCSRKDLFTVTSMQFVVAECYRTVSENATTPLQPLLLDEHKVLKLIFCASVSMSIETEVLLVL